MQALVHLKGDLWAGREGIDNHCLYPGTMLRIFISWKLAVTALETLFTWKKRRQRSDVNNIVIVLPWTLTLLMLHQVTFNLSIYVGH